MAVETLGAAAAVVLAVLAVVWLGQRHLIYFPSGAVPPPPAVGLAPAEVVALETEDGLLLEGWFVSAFGAATGYTVLAFPGNAGHRADRAAFAAQLAARGFAVLLVDYRGYGGNPGLPSEEGLARDARAALAFLLGRPDVDPSRLIYAGESLGSAVAIRLAVEHAPALLVLRSPFTSLVDMGRLHYPLLPARLLLRDRYPSLDRMKAVTSPVLVVAGEFDEIVPLAQSQAIYDSAPCKARMVVVPDADHNDEEMEDAVVQSVQWVQ
jgi:uncharacterized protein